MPEQITVLLRDLPKEASISDVETFVKLKLADADPDVKPILHDPISGRGFTTVTLLGRTRPECISAYKKLAADKFLYVEKEGKKFPIGISQRFRGMTILAGEQTHPDFE